MISRTEKFRLGVFLLVAIGFLVLTIVVLTGYRLTRSIDIYTVRFKESVSGLEVGAQVKYNGVRIGQVTDIEIVQDDLDQVVTTLALRAGTPIKADSKAVLVSMGITGLRFIEIAGGTSKSKLLPPGTSIPSGRSLMGTLEGKAGDIAVKTELAITKINQLLSDDAIDDIHKIVENVREISTDIDALLKENKEKISQIISDFTDTGNKLKSITASADRSAKRLEGVFEAADPKVADILDNINATTKDFRRAGRSLSRIDKILKGIGNTLNKFNTHLKDVDISKIAGDAEVAVAQAKEALKALRRLVEASRGNIHQSTKSLKNTLRNLEVLSAELKDQPSLLLKSKPPEERTSGEK